MKTTWETLKIEKGNLPIATAKYKKIGTLFWKLDIVDDTPYPYYILRTDHGPDDIRTCIFNYIKTYEE
jgi:hypothetical protein